MRFSFLFASLVVMLCWAFLSLLAASSAEDKQTISKPAQLERKNFVEKVSGFKMIGNLKAPLNATFEMVSVPGGEFVMGSDEKGEGPKHKVKVGALWAGKCEVTWDEYECFWEDETFPRGDDDVLTKGLGPDAVTRPTPVNNVDFRYDQGEHGHPALCMSHHAAMVYCNWLNAKTGHAYRLPTEAEWEYLARGGKGETAYSFGNDPAHVDKFAWYAGNSRDPDFPKMPLGCTHKVGTKKPNPFGLYDMYGNVWEWTLDQYDPLAYEKFAKNPLSLRPVTAPTEKKWSHVVRGGSWADKAERCRSSTRRISDVSWMKHDPNLPQSIWWLTRMDVIGIRVVLAEEEQAELIGLKPKVRKKQAD